TDKSKITRKQSKASKHGHENQKSTKRSQRSKAEARKVNPSQTLVKAQRGVGFCAKTLTQEAQMHPRETDTLAILRCPQLDQTATIEAQMIGK
ncbi:hypothetical protein Tco_0297974, partial [Tanacetum coccineum]